MKKVNLLSRAEMKKVMGGSESVTCIYSTCTFRGPENAWISGACGKSINGKECRCIVLDGNGDPYQSIEMEGCYA